jgi:serine/threonine protein kinase
MKQINGYVFDTNDQLGKGSFGCVYRGIQEGTQKICAIKVI